MHSSTLWTCSHCGKVLMRKNIYSHLRVVHYYTTEQIDEIKASVRREAPVKKEFVSCPLCEERFDNHERFAMHCQEEHAEDGAGGEPQDYTVFTLFFETKREYDAWLEEQQEHGGTSFYTRDSSKSKGTASLRCNRAGKYTKETDTRATHTKRDVLHCSCFLNVKVEENGAVSVKGCLGHVGHTIESALLRLTAAQQLFLKGLLEEYSHEYIIRRLRKDYPAKTSRLHFVTKGDLWRIANRFGLRPGYRHKDDMLSLEQRAKEKNPDDGIRLFEMPVNPTGEGFRLIIITPQQVEWLQKFSHRGISVDDTHNATRYNLKLATVMVLNERDAGVPAAFLLSGTMTSVDVEKLFLEIRNLVPDFNPLQIVTDEAPSFYNGFRSVFPNSRAQLHYCRWHIDRTWQRNANKFVEPRLRGQVKRRLKDLLVIQDLHTFEQRFAEVLAFLQVEGQDRMEDYLRRNYLGKFYLNLT
ncbi:zinc finger, C2H2 type [Cooperia oncophora]